MQRLALAIAVAMSPERAHHRAVADENLRGAIVPILTLYDQNLTVNHAEITKNVQYLLSKGLKKGNAVFLAAASGGDFPSLTVEERKATAKTIVEAAGDVPVLVCAQHTILQESIEIAKWAEEIGAYGVQLSVPYYWGATPGDALAWFTAVHDATEKVQFLFYNVPWEGFDAPISLLQEIAEKLPRVVGLKYATETAPQAFNYIQAVSTLSKDFAILDNMELPIMNYMMGGQGFVTHLATIWPEKVVEQAEKLAAKDYEGAQEIFMQTQVPFYAFRAAMGGVTSGESPPVKAALEMVGRYGGPNRLPSRSLDATQLADLKKMLQQIGFLPKDDALFA